MICSSIGWKRLVDMCAAKFYEVSDNLDSPSSVILIFYQSV